MKILIISAHWPWPLSTGGSVAQFGWIDYLRHRHEITLLIPVYVAVSLPAVEKLRQLWPEVKLAPVVSPQLDAKPTLVGAAKAAIRQLPFIKTAYHASARRLKAPPRGSGQLAALPDFLVRAAAAEGRRGYDLIQVEYIEMLSMFHVLPPDIPKLFSHIELHYVVRERARNAASRADVYEDYLFAQEKSYELDSLRHYDGIATMSENDRKVLQAELPECDIHASPFAFVNPPDQRADFKLSPFAGRITYIGGSVHPPNVDAVNWFLETMWPSLTKRFPGLVFHIIGEWDSLVRQRLASIPGVIFTGFVEDVSAILQGSIMVVPLRVGSGIRTKILMAMTLGVPVVTTRVGVEGIDATDQNELLCADSPDSFGEAIGRLIQDQSVGNRLARNAFAFVQSSYSLESAGARRDAIYHMVYAKYATSAGGATQPRTSSTRSDLA